MVFHTIRLAKRLQQCFDFQSTAFSLSYSQTTALIILAGRRKFSQKELAQRLHLSPPSIVDLVDGLERLELVKREIPNGDRRRNIVVLTSQGKKIVKKLIDLSYKLDDFLKSRLQSETVSAFHLALNRIDHYLNEWKGGEK